MSAVSAMAERLRMTALTLENRYTSSVASMSPRRSVRSYRQNSPRPRHHQEHTSASQASTPRRQSTVNIYQELADGGGGISLAALMTALARYDVQLEAATVELIFASADADKDGLLSQAEFRTLSHDYATLVQCLTTRARRRHKEQELAESIDAAKARLTALVEEDERDSKAAEGARKDLMARYETLKGRQSAAAEVDVRLRNAKSVLEATNEELQTATNDSHAMVTMLKKCQQYSKQAADDMRDAEDVRDHALQQLKAQEAKEAVSADRLRELQEQVKQQQEEVERQHQRTQRLFQEAKKATKACDTSKQAIAKWKGDTDECEKRRDEADNKVRGTADRQKEVTAKHTRYEQQLKELVTECSAAERQVQTLEKRSEELEGQRISGQRPTQLRVKEKERTVERMQAEAEAEATQRRAVEDEEMPVLRMEVKLRQQRETLEAAERELRQSRSDLDKRSLAGGADGPGGIGSTAPSYDPSLGTSPDRYEEEEDPLADALSSPRHGSGTSNTFAPTITTASPLRRSYYR